MRLIWRWILRDYVMICMLLLIAAAIILATGLSKTKIIFSSICGTVGMAGFLHDIWHKSSPIHLAFDNILPPPLWVEIVAITSIIIAIHYYFFSISPYVRPIHTKAINSGYDPTVVSSLFLTPFIISTFWYFYKARFFAIKLGKSIVRYAFAGGIIGIIIGGYKLVAIMRLDFNPTIIGKIIIFSLSLSIISAMHASLGPMLIGTNLSFMAICIYLGPPYYHLPGWQDILSLITEIKPNPFLEWICAFLSTGMAGYRVYEVFKQRIDTLII